MGTQNPNYSPINRFYLFIPALAKKPATPLKKNSYMPILNILPIAKPMDLPRD